MIPETIHEIKEKFANCCPGVKKYMLTRHLFAEEKTPHPSTQCEVFCDLSDKTTFFAWQRNHMANERTFLAWCRTGVAFIAFGFVIERFDILIRQLNAYALASPNSNIPAIAHGTGFLGIAAFTLGAVIMLMAGWRFFYIRKHINQGETEFSVLPDMVLMGSILVTIGGIFVFFTFFF